MKMKIMTITALSCFLSFWGASDANAQKDDKNDDKKTSFSAGWVNATITSDLNRFKEENKGGLYVGIQRSKKIVPMLHVFSGLFYYQCGTANQSFNNEDDNLKSGDVKLNYLQIPLGLRLKVGPAFAETGFAGAYRIAGKIEDDKLKQEDWNRWDATFFAGAGFKFLMLSANLRYHWGLGDVYKGAGSSGENSRNGYLALGLGLSL